MLNYFNVYMYVPGTSYQTLNENIFLSCVLMRTIFPKSLFTQIWIKKTEKSCHTVQPAKTVTSPGSALQGTFRRLHVVCQMSSKTHDMCLTLSRTPSQFFVHASIHFPAPCLMLNKRTCGQKDIRLLSHFVHVYFKP